VSTTIALAAGSAPSGIAVSPGGSKLFVYVTDLKEASVTVINGATNTVLSPAIPVGNAPDTPDGSKVYVANGAARPTGTVSVIDTATNTASTTIGVGAAPVSFGQFIQPLYLAGTSGSPDCNDKSVSALAQQFRGFAHAADTLGFASVKALQNTIKAFCDPATN
jgi:YVTN family beta-propeller protein